MDNKLLTKTSYVKGINCPKSFWMEVNLPNEAKDTGGQKEIEEGIEIGKLAREYFLGSILVSKAHPSVMVKETEELMKQGVLHIAEASFMVDGLFCSVDILQKNINGYDIIEVKGTNDVKKNKHLPDVAFQKYVLEKAGIQVNRVMLMHLNPAYIRQGELDLNKLFKIDDVTDLCMSAYAAVKENCETLLNLIKEDEPKTLVSSHCKKCPFKEHCHKDFSSPSILDVRRGGAKIYNLFNEGMRTYEELYESKACKLSPAQEIQVQVCATHSGPYIELDNIREFLSNITYPAYHLDFETIDPAIPLFDGTKPYQQIPVQYSLHIEEPNKPLIHKEFLAKEGESPLRACAESLVKDFPKDVTIIAYHADFERARLRELAAYFPDLSDHLLAMADNVVDLEVPFAKMYMYTEEMGGRSSIKAVLPAFYPNDEELDYHALNQVHNGTEAVSAYLSLTKVSPKEALETRNNLLRYCCLDTLAEVKVLEKLREVAK